MRSGPDAATVAQARSRRDLLKNEIAGVIAKMGEVDLAAGDLQQRAQAALAAHSERSAEAIIAGEQPPPMSREDADLVREARQVAGYTPAAREKLERRRSELASQLIEAEAALAGAASGQLRDRQRGAQARITHALDSAASDLAELLAIEDAIQRFCSGPQIMRLQPGEAPPWSGAVVVQNLVERLPGQFRAPSLELAELRRRSKPLAQALIAEIEGDSIG